MIDTAVSYAHGQFSLTVSDLTTGKSAGTLNSVLARTLRRLQGAAAEPAGHEFRAAVCGPQAVGKSALLTARTAE